MKAIDVPRFGVGDPDEAADQMPLAAEFLTCAGKISLRPPRVTSLGAVHSIVRDGMVTLTGVVASEDERRTADVIARHAYGAWIVDNQLRLER